MKRVDAVSFEDIKRGFSAADPKRTKQGKKIDLSLRKVEEPDKKFGNECMCQSDIFDYKGV